MKRFLLVALVACTYGRAEATTVWGRDLEDAVAHADVVLRGRVIGVLVVPDRHFGAVTAYTLRVQAVFKGAAAATVVVETPGGTVGPDRFVVAGSPDLAVGQEIVVLLERRDGVYVFAGLALGVWRLAASPAGGTNNLEARRSLGGLSFLPGSVVAPDRVLPARELVERIERAARGGRR